MSQQPFTLSAFSQKLIFSGGVSPPGDTQEEASKLLTEDALNVCKLLAINPDDVITRNISQFREKGLSKQRL